MGARARVLRLERARERRHGLLVRLLEQDALPALDFEQMAEVARVQLELLLHFPRPRRPEREGMHAAGEALDDGEQLERAEGFADERVRARLVCPRLRAPVRAGEK